jgi:hypothetical protein
LAVGFPKAAGSSLASLLLKHCSTVQLQHAATCRLLLSLMYASGFNA